MGCWPEKAQQRVEWWLGKYGECQQGVIYYQEDIFKEHQISEKQFQESYDYYAKHSKQFDHMYEVIIDSLKVKEATGKLK